MGRKKKDNTEPEIHDELKGFEIHINEFGEIKSSYSVDKLNEFLNENIDDKKLKEQTESEEDLEE